MNPDTISAKERVDHSESAEANDGKRFAANATNFAFSHQHFKAQEPNFGKYEEDKAAWMKANPDATPMEYEVAMRANARECGF